MKLWFSIFLLALALVAGCGGAGVQGGTAGADSDEAVDGGSEPVVRRPYVPPSDLNEEDPDGSVTETAEMPDTNREDGDDDDGPVCRDEGDCGDDGGDDPADGDIDGDGEPDPVSLICNGGCEQEGVVNDPFSMKFTALRGTTYVWTMTPRESLSGITFRDAGGNAFLEGTPTRAGRAEYVVKVCESGTENCAEKTAVIEVADDFIVRFYVDGRVKKVSDEGNTHVEVPFGGAVGIKVVGHAEGYDISLEEGGEFFTLAKKGAHSAFGNMSGGAGMWSILGRLAEMVGFNRKSGLQRTSGVSDSNSAEIRVKGVTDDRAHQVTIRVRAKDPNHTPVEISFYLKFRPNPCLTGPEIISSVIESDNVDVPEALNMAWEKRNVPMAFRAESAGGPVNWELIGNGVEIGGVLNTGFSSCQKDDENTTDRIMRVWCSFEYGNALPEAVKDKTINVNEVFTVRARLSMCSGSSGATVKIYKFQLYPDLTEIDALDLYGKTAGFVKAHLVLASGTTDTEGASVRVMLTSSEPNNVDEHYDCDDNDVHDCADAFFNLDDIDDSRSFVDNFHGESDDDYFMYLKDVRPFIRVEQNRPGDDDANMELDVSYLILSTNHHFAVFDDREGGVPRGLFDSQACAGGEEIGQEVFWEDNVFEPDKPNSMRYAVSSDGDFGLVVMDLTPFFAGFNVIETAGAGEGQTIPDDSIHDCRDGDPASIWQRSPMPYKTSDFINGYIINEDYSDYIANPDQ